MSKRRDGRRPTTLGSLPHGRGSVPQEGAPSRSRLCWPANRAARVSKRHDGCRPTTLGSLPHGRGSVPQEGAPSRSRLCWPANRAARVSKRRDGCRPTTLGSLPHGRGSVPQEGAPSRSRLCCLQQSRAREQAPRRLPSHNVGIAPSRSRLRSAGDGRSLTVAAPFRRRWALPHGRGSVPHGCLRSSNHGSGSSSGSKARRGCRVGSRVCSVSQGSKALAMLARPVAASSG